MGLLVRFHAADAPAFKALYEAFMIASKPKTVKEMRPALAIQDKLEAISAEIEGTGNIKSRDLIEAPSAVFFETAEFEYMRSVLDEVNVPQLLVRTFVRLHDILDETEKEWKGDERTLRTRFDPGPPAKAPEVADVPY